MPYVTSWERMARKEGVNQGVKQEKLETARRMLGAKLSLEDIARFTGLTKKEIKALMQEQTQVEN